MGNYVEAESFNGDIESQSTTLIFDSTQKHNSPHQNKKALSPFHHKKYF